ncbi:MAG: glycosyl hydrolase family 8 [Bacteroidetes bacterium]|nr:glycosyl hydrolase family 8 [Bacteroidota bacterium]
MKDYSSLIKMNFTRYIYILFAVFLWNTATAQVPVHINSGNPKYPFPQFLEYTYKNSHRLGNLGTKNAEGVVHAEMEQDIIDAYKIHANEFAYTGESWAGIKYIWTPYKAAYDCTEGDGYALLAAAYMADQVTFNGYWMCTHDKRRSKTKRYRDCSDNAPGYAYGPYALSDNGTGGNTAADGDVDVALALYVAYMQWGEFMRNEAGAIVNDACGNPISYYKEMIEVIRGLVARSTRFPTENPRRHNSGMIGFDGYPKGGDTWNEQTNWASTNPLVVGGVSIIPEFGGPTAQHIDYNAPAYYRQFYELLQAENGDPWEIEQFRRGEASSDWLMGKMLDVSAKTIPTAGWVDVKGGSNNTPVYSNFNQGEDFRTPWRTISSYVWHGNPTYSWDPVNHKVVNGGNSYELDIATRFAKFLNNPQGAPWNNLCVGFGGGPKISYKGPATLQWYYNTEGLLKEPEPDPDNPNPLKSGETFTLNWLQGTGIFSAIAVQDYELMGLMYRQCNIEWDSNSGTDNYLGSKPNYFHGWFRQLGMLAASGNYPAPSEMKPVANMKIYRAIKDSVTFAFTGDQLTYLLDYRNYGSVDATGVKIVEQVPKDFVFVSATNGGVYDAGSHTVTWNIGTVPGFKTGGLAATKGQVSYVVQVGDKASGRYCTTAEITCTNGKGWITNEYPNYKTATMQRNCVDIVKRALKIEKSVNRTKLNDGNMATFTIDFENSIDAGWIDGGRPRVNVAYSNKKLSNPTEAQEHWLRIRLYNDAIEPYINYGNYRISYYVYDAGLTCYKGYGDCTTGWQLDNDIYEGGNKAGVQVSHENIVYGSDVNGKWNQRLIVQFAPLLVTTTAQLSNYFGMDTRIHKGGTSPLRAVWRMHPEPYVNVNYADDWSWDPNANDAEDGLYHPISPSWQKLGATGKSIEEPVTSWIPAACETANHVVTNMLVEEYDGYVWRRILGNGPMPGRDINNVVIRDTLPKGLTFNEFIGNCPLADNGAKWSTAKAPDGRDIIIWTIPKLQVKQKGKITYSATAKFPSGKTCQTADEDIINYAWIFGDKESPVADTAKLTVTCAKVPEPIVPTTLKKTADKAKYSVGDPITYTIEYEQTHGSIVKNAGSIAGDWQTSNWNFSAGKLTTVSNQTGTTLFDYGYGKNGYVEFECAAQSDATFQVLLRNGSSNISLQIKPVWAGLELTCYKGSTVAKATQTVTYGGGSPFIMRIDLTEDLLRVWVNKDTTQSPIFTVENLPVGVGKFGFKNGAQNGSDSYGIHSVSNIYTHFDYAYNLSIIDKMPAGISFVSADNSGAHSAGTITWNFETGKNNPIPYGKKYTVTWKGTVNTCNELIINVASVKLMGHADDAIMAQAVSECAAVNLCPTPPTATVTGGATYCEGATSIADVVVTFSGGATPYKYIGTRQGTTFAEETTTGTNTTAILSTPKPSAAGSYTYELTSFKDANGCEGTLAIKSQTITINPKLETEIKETGTALEYCTGTSGVNLSLSKNFIGANYEWFKNNGSLGAASTTATTLSGAKEGNYYCKITLDNCIHTTKTVKVVEQDCTEPCISPTVTIVKKEICEDGSIYLKFTGIAPFELDYTFNGTRQTITVSGKDTVLKATQTGKNVFIAYNLVDRKGCFSDFLDENTVKINDVVWAKYNVDAPGTFVKNPEDAGMFYQWNSKIGWSSANPLVSSPVGNTWNDSWDGGGATTWEMANNVCPTGFRLPTKTDLQSLQSTAKQAKTINGVYGTLFGSGSNTVFLPAVGYRHFFNGALGSAGSDGYYWSSTEYGSGSAYYVNFYSSNASVSTNSRIYGFSVRCVKDFQIDTIAVLLPDTTRINETIFVGESYNKNGFTIPVQNKAGTILYTLPLQNQYGCDSTVILTLKVECVTNKIEITDNIYVGESYTKHGFTIAERTTAGTETHTLPLQNQYGCDSIIILKLKILCTQFTVTVSENFVCQNDVIHLKFTGVAPFELDYKFNGIRKKITVSGTDTVLTVTKTGENVFVVYDLINGEGCAVINPEDVVEINGVVWANRNVDTPGTFVKNPEDVGMFYQWNRKVAWAAKGAVTGWDSSTPTGTKWEKENDPCPTGYRIPNKVESLNLSESDYTSTFNYNGTGVRGLIFSGSGSNTFFIPAAGYRSGSNGALSSTALPSYYWKDFGTAFGIVDGTINNNIVHSPTNGYFVRCVKDLQTDTITVFTPDTTRINETIFVGESYNDNGFTIPIQTTAGTISKTLPLKNQFLCDSIVILELKVIEVVCIPPTVTILENSVCQNNTIHLKFTGIAPFELDYKFNGTRQKIIVSGMDTVLKVTQAGENAFVVYDLVGSDGCALFGGNSEDGVEINGLIWAKYNVDAPGTFAVNPQDAGKFYQWNRKVAWAATGTVTGWNYTTPTGTEWEKVNDPCPVGYRVPTKTERDALVAAGSTWTSNYNGTGVAGRIFGSGSNTVFLPAAGYRSYSIGTLVLAGTDGYYWSSTESGSSNAYYVNFHSGNVSMSNTSRIYGNSVRCVKDLQTDTITVFTPDTTRINETIFVGESYNKNGFTIPVQTTVGTVFDTLPLKNQFLCDSIVILELEVVCEKIPDISAQGWICQGDSIFWEGRYLHKQGCYVDTITTPAGCKSTIELCIRVYPRDTTHINETIFVGEGYAKNGFTIPVQTETGTVRDTLFLKNKKPFPCDSLVILNLRVVCTISDTTEIADNIFVGESYNKNGFTIPVQNKAGTVFDTLRLQNQYECDSTVILKLEVWCIVHGTLINDTVFVGEGYNKNGFTIPGQTAIGTTLYTLPLQSQYGCDSTVILNLEVIYICENIAEYIDAVMCEGDSTFFGGKYRYTSGVYHETTTLASGCEINRTLALYVYPPDTTRINATIFVGESYNENGFEIPVQNKAGTVFDTLRLKNKCGNIVILKLEVECIEHKIYLIDDIFVGEKYEKYGFEIPEQNTAGTKTYTLSLKNQYDCDSLVILNLEVKPLANTSPCDAILLCDSETLSNQYPPNSVMYSVTPSCSYTIRFNRVVFYKMIAKENGTFTFKIKPSQASDYDWALWKNIPNCNDISTVEPDRFSANDGIGSQSKGHTSNWETGLDINKTETCDPAGAYTDGFVAALPVRAGDKLLLAINLAQNSLSDYELIFGNGLEEHQKIKFLCQEELLIEDTICQHEEYNDYGFDLGVQTNAGTFFHTKDDGITTLKLTVNPVYNLHDSKTICINELPYTYRDTVFKAGTLSGEFIFNRKTVNNCDSIVTLDLTVNEVHTTFIADAIFVGEPYNENGFTISERTMAGTEFHTLPLKNKALCDSIVILELKVLCNSDTTRLADIILVGEDYNKNGFEIPGQATTGTILRTLYLKNQYLCDSIVILELRVVCMNSAVLMDAVMCEGDSTFFGGEYLYTSGVYHTTTTLASGCEISKTLALYVYPRDTTRINDTIFVGESYGKYGFTIPVQNKAGTVFDTLRLKPPHKCDSTVILNLMVFPVVYKTLCSSELPFVFAATTFAQGTQSGTYIIDEGLSSMTKLELTINPTPAPPQLSSTNFCFGAANTELTATGDAGSTITWYNKAGTQVHTDEKYTPNDKIVGTYEYFATQKVNGCESEKAPVTYTIKPLPPAPMLTISPTKICDYDTEPQIKALVANENTATITWYKSQNKADRLPIFDGKFEITADKTVNAGLQYFATQTVDGCESLFSAGASYTIENPVAPPSVTNAAMCENATSVPSLKTTSMYAKWYKTEVPHPAKPTETPLATGTTYTPTNITATTTYYVQNEIDGCRSPMTPVTMTVIDIPTINIGSDIDFCEYSEAKVTAQNLNPAMTATSRIDWRLTAEEGTFNKLLVSESKNGEYFVTLNNTVVPSTGNYVLTAIYTVESCSSAPQAIAVRMHDRPNPPIAASKIVCQGAVLEPLQAFGSSNIQWIFKNGEQTLPNWIGETYDFNKFNYKEIKVGQYEFELFDTDAVSGCKSAVIPLTFEIAPAAKTKIVGRSKLCAGTSLEEAYGIEVVPAEQSNYYWSTSGTIFNYTKDGNQHSPNRYIDWHEAGIDTIYVRESTWAGCEGFDTLVVKIAEYPQAYYTWSLPGASTTIEFMDSSYQAPIVSRYDKKAKPVHLTYTMSWNFDRTTTNNPYYEDWFAEYPDRNKPVTAEDYTFGHKYPKLTVTNEYGCTDTYSTEVFVDIRAGVYIPNAFSPDNPAVSVRVFKPVAFNLEYCKLWIYDKWGNLLYYSDEVVDGMFAGEWNGIYNNEPLPPEVYIWKMEAKFLDGTTWAGQKKAIGYSKFGSVVLIR